MWVSPDSPKKDDDLEMLSKEMHRIDPLHRQPMKIEGGVIHTWHSICSIHYFFDPECSMCQKGTWYTQAQIEADKKYFDALKNDP